MKPKNTKHLMLAGAAFALMIAMANAAHAQAREFDIAAQDLGAALLEFGEQSGVSVAAPRDLVKDKRAPAVRGEMELEEALEKILKGSGLVRNELTSGGYTITLASAEVTEPASQPFRVAQVDQGEDVREVGDGETRRLEDRDRREDTIVVTGSRIRGADSASPVTTITREDIDLGGFGTVEEILDTLPQNFGAGASSEIRTDDNIFQAIGGDVRAAAGGASVNLRGLGASSTLVLLNGRRLSPGGNEARFTNISSIPTSAIERVEVLTDGASAIYGSDAIAGVVNFILRDDYEGAETRIRYGSDLRGGTSNIQAGQSFGTSWDTGNVLLSYEYYNSDALAASDRDFTASNDLTPFGGTDRRRPGGNPANIIAGGQTFAIPSGQDGSSLTSSDFDITLEPNRFNEREFRDQTPDIERNSAFLFITQNINNAELFAQGRYSKEENSFRLSQFPSDLSVSSTSPFFVDPTGGGLTNVTVSGYDFTQDFGPFINEGEIDSYGATFGARFEMWGDWRSELIGNWSREDAISRTRNNIDFAGVLTAVNNADPQLAFNPFGDGANTDPQLISNLVDRTATIDQEFENELWSVGLNIDGTLFSTPGGGVKLASGIEYREEELRSDFANSPDIADLNREVIALYGEVFVPLVSDANARPGIERLEISLAGRYEDYSDFGDTTNPKFGLLWAPTDSIALRGTYGTSFRAPALRDLDGSARGGNVSIYFPDLFVNFGLIPFPFLLLNGANEELRPEKATTWTAGFDWQPEVLEGLTLDVSYFNIDFEDRIGRPIANGFAELTDPRFASLVTLNPSSDEIANIVNDPRFNPDIPFGPGNPQRPEDLVSGALPVGAILNARQVNSARLRTQGLEVQVSYDFDTEIGAIGLDFNGNYIFDFERQLIDTDPLFDEVDTLGRPVEFRARAGINWSRGNWTAAGFANYTDGYVDQFSSPERKVDDWTTVDLTLAYNTGDRSNLLSDTRVSVTASNLFNEDPPFVDTAGGVGYDANNANPLGRMVSFQVTKQW